MLEASVAVLLLSGMIPLVPPSEGAVAFGLPVAPNDTTHPPGIAPSRQCLN